MLVISLKPTPEFAGMVAVATISWSKYAGLGLRLREQESGITCAEEMEMLSDRNAPLLQEIPVLIERAKAKTDFVPGVRNEASNGEAKKELIVPPSCA